MTRTVFIDCGAAETRAAMFDGDEVTHFWFGPARGDEGLPRSPQTGDIVSGRVKSVAKSLNGAFVDIGAERDGFLPLSKDAKPPVEGARLIASVRRPQIDAKGAVLTLDWASGLSALEKAKSEAQAASSAVGLIGEVSDAALSAVRHFARIASGAAVAVNDPAVKSVLERHGAAVRVEPAQDWDDVITRSLERSVGLASGALLHFHETKAGALIDIDTASASDGATGALNDKINLAAAAHLPKEISRRAIAGRVIIDFLPPSGAGARAKLLDALRAGVAGLPRARLGKLAPDGLCDLTMPREQHSLLEAATEFSTAGWPVEGRRFTLDWSTKSAMRSLEKALRARPSASIRLLVASDIGAYLSDLRPQWAQRLAQKYGARFTIEPGATMETRTHEIA
ncbi:MAG: ribonuclease E/G [Pseudomonadota bacterium]